MNIFYESIKLSDQKQPVHKRMLEKSKSHCIIYLKAAKNLSRAKEI